MAGARQVEGNSTHTTSFKGCFDSKVAKSCGVMSQVSNSSYCTFRMITLGWRSLKALTHSASDIATSSSTAPQSRMRQTAHDMRRGCILHEAGAHISLIQILPRHFSLIQIPPRHIPLIQILPRHISLIQILPRHISLIQILPRRIPLIQILPRHISLIQIVPRRISLIAC